MFVPPGIVLKSKSAKNERVFVFMRLEHAIMFFLDYVEFTGWTLALMYIYQHICIGLEVEETRSLMSRKNNMGDLRCSILD